MQENNDVVSAGGGANSFQRRKRGPKMYPLYPVTPKHAIKRNEPCPCGSGKKAKKCCLARISALASLPVEVRTQMITEGILHNPQAGPKAPPAAVQARFNELVAQQTATQQAAATADPQSPDISFTSGEITTADGDVISVESGTIQHTA